MLEFYKNASDVVQGEEIAWKGNVFNPVMLENIDKWKNQLQNYEVQNIEYVLSNEIKNRIK